MTSLIQILGALITLGGFGFGLYQFYSALKWKRSEFAAKQLERIQSDPILVAATRVLDWRARSLPVPPSLRLGADEESFVHTWELLADGILPERQRDSFTRPMEIYRDLFDSLFGYFDELNHYVAIGLITSDQLTSLRYWLRQISAPRFGGDVRFGPYLREYGFPGTLALMTRLGVEPPAP